MQAVKFEGEEVFKTITPHSVTHLVFLGDVFHESLNRRDFRNSTVVLAMTQCLLPLRLLQHGPSKDRALTCAPPILASMPSPNNPLVSISSKGMLPTKVTRFERSIDCLSILSTDACPTIQIPLCVSHRCRSNASISPCPKCLLFFNHQQQAR